MSKQDAVRLVEAAIGTAGWVHGRNANGGNQDLVDLANAIRQVALAVEALAKAVD